MIWLIVIFLVVALTAHAPELVGWVIERYKAWLYAGSKQGKRE